MRYVLGVDGGGTKTHCALFGADGVKADFFDWGPTNFENMEHKYDGLLRELSLIFARLIERNGMELDDISHGVLGLAGVDSPTRHKKISEVLAKAGLARFTLVNDAFLGVKAGSASGSGVCAINGTGTSFAGIDPGGALLHVGGMGVLTGDIGGGHYLSGLAAGSVYNQLYKGSEPTVMKDLMFDILGVERREDYLDALLEQLFEGELEYASLNKVVFRAANMGDAVAIAILEGMGRDNARSVSAVINGLDFADTVEVVLAGSINTKGENPSALDAFKRTLTDMHGDKRLSFTKLTVPPVAGAIVWALEIAAGGRPRGMYEAVIKQFV